jgi:Fic family protein
MTRSAILSAEIIAKLLRDAGPAGLGPEQLEAKLPKVSRSTLSRRLNDLAARGEIKVMGRGRAVRYIAVAAYSIDEVRRYFDTDWQTRPVISFQEALLQPMPNIDRDTADRLLNLHALARCLDRKFLADFLIDFSWASSALEGSTYSAIDTQALIEYGERNKDKPTEDAVLILNHKNAIQFLWAQRELTTENLCQMQGFLTDGHQLDDVADSDHFLPVAQRGVVREYEEVRLGRSAYNPPFRPASGYIAKAFSTLLATARELAPVQAAFYLMTRIPYLQVFANGNKRTARLAANLPLLHAGLLPLSFVDFKKADYVLGMSAFYELGDTQLIQQVFLDGYVRSIIRGSNIPAAQRLSGFRIDDVAQALLRYVRSGETPTGNAAIFLSR